MGHLEFSDTFFRKTNIVAILKTTLQTVELIIMYIIYFMAEAFAGLVDSISF